MDTFNPGQMPPIGTQNDKKSFGPLIAVIIILALIIIGGLYFLKTRSTQQNTYVPVQNQTEDNITASLKQQGSSDDLNSIESDLKATDVNSLDQGAAVIDAQLK
jgi:cytoskeletal protein RodZ